MKGLLILLLLASCSSNYKTSKNELLTIKNEDLNKCTENINNLYSKLIVLSEDENVKLERDFSLPTDEKIATKIIREYNPTEYMGNSLRNYGLKTLMEQSDELEDKVMSCPIFHKLEFNKALIGAVSENKWSKSFTMIAQKKLLLNLVSESAGISSVMNSVTNLATLKYASDKGLFKNQKKNIDKKYAETEKNLERLNSKNYSKEILRMKEIELAQQLQLAINDISVNLLNTEAL